MQVEVTFGRLPHLRRTVTRDAQEPVDVLGHDHSLVRTTWARLAVGQIVHGCGVVARIAHLRVAEVLQGGARQTPRQIGGG